MKKLISLVLALISIFTVCLVPAYADEFDGYEAYQVKLYFLNNEYNYSSLMIVFDKKFVKFGDDIKITFNYWDGSKIECKNFECFSDTYRDDGEENTCLFIIVKNLNPGQPKSIAMAENVAYDSQGNGNKAIDNCMKRGLYYIARPSHKEDDASSHKYLKGDEITYSTPLPCDFYVNGELVAKNTYEYKLKINELKKYTVSVKLRGIEYEQDSFDSALYKKYAKENEAKAIGNALVGVAISPFALVLSPLYMIFPLVGISAAISPFTSVISVFIHIIEYLHVTLMR